MTIFQAIILGIIQGLTEYLPISSSAHLVIAPFLFGWVIPEGQVFPFDVLVQIGTLVAVIGFFWKDLFAMVGAVILGIVRRKPFTEPQARLGWYIVLATIPAGMAGVFLKDMVEQAFHSPVAVAWFLLGTAALLTLAELLGRRTRNLSGITWKDALWIGLFQAVSIFPGMSRSGATISGGMIRNLERKEAARFSFLMAVPIMLAAGGLGVVDLFKTPGWTAFLPVLLAGFITAGVVGYFSIKWLLSFLARRPLYWFAGYCVLLAAVTLLVAYVA